MEQQRLLVRVARDACLPYLLTLPRFREQAAHLTFLLVGSVATGRCGEQSDIDIAVLCEPNVYEAVSDGTAWDAGRPSETEVDGVQLHYFAASFDDVEAKLRQLDDVFLHVYGTAVVLRDPGDQYAKRIAWVHEQAKEIRKERLEGKLDMLIRRSRALEQCLATCDELATARVGIELIARCAKIAALLDNAEFDPRKHLLETALNGTTGRQLENGMKQLLSSIGALGQIRDPDDVAHWGFPATLRAVVETLSAEARKQGFRVGLDHPDRRQAGE